MNLGRRIVCEVAILVAFLAIALVVRGSTVSILTWLNPDEAELIAQGRAALLSPVPYTTWTVGTTGPFWVLFVALAGWLGIPLTIGAAHVLAALLVGVIGYLGCVLLRRAVGTLAGVLIAVAWWVPFALVYPWGSRTDFGALNTELLPAALVLAAAAVPIKAIAVRPWWIALAGALCGIAVAAKYQVLPVAATLLLVQVLLVPEIGWRRGIGLLLRAAAGAAAPVVLVLVVVLVTPGAGALLVENLGFLGSYAGGVDLTSRIGRSTLLIATQPFFWAAAAGLVAMTVLSTRRVALARVVLVLGGLAAVYAGGMAFGHYLILLYAAMLLAVALPVRDGIVLLRGRLRSIAAVAVTASLVAGLVVVGLANGRLILTTPASLARALDPAEAPTDPDVARACPPGSTALVWGWAAELYVDYQWRNAVPFMNTLGIATNPALRDSNETVVIEAIAASDCVVDAVGDPFFAVTSDQSLDRIYPGVRDDLESFRLLPTGAVDCAECRVWVRR